MKRAAIALSSLFIALLPLGWPALPWNMQIGDLIFPLLCVAIIVAGWRTSFHRLDLFVAAFLLGSLASLPASHSARASLFGLAKEIYVVAIYVATSVIVGELGAERVSRWFTQSVVALCLLSLAGAAVFYATGIAWQPLGDPGRLPYVGTVFRVWGLTTGPELIGNLLAFTLPLIALDTRALLTPGRAITVVALVFAVEAMTFSFAVAGFAAAFAVALWPSLRRWSHWTVTRTALASAAAAVVLIVNVAAIAAVRQVEVGSGKNSALGPATFPYVRPDSPADMVSLRVSYYPMSYFVIKRVAWSAFLEHPLTGIGLDAFPTETQRAYDDGRLYSPYQRVAPHSTLFGRLAETGLVGTLPLVAFLAAMIVTALQATRSPAADPVLAWAVLAGCTGLLVSSLNVDIMNFRFFWFGAGIIRALTLTSRAPGRAVPGQRDP